MTSRHIPVKIRRQIEEKFGRVCGFPRCRKPALELHHSKRFALSKRHELNEIVPLCKTHHELAHAGLIWNEDLSVTDWKLKIEQNKKLDTRKIDELVKNKREESLRMRLGEDKQKRGQP